jgi:xanthine dehydrogenase accessory factor
VTTEDDRAPDSPERDAGEAPGFSALPGTPFIGLVAGADPEVWSTVARWQTEGRVCALLTVIDTRGFTPRKPGAHMLLAADGETFGTIGGGAIEQDALRAARELLARGHGSTVLARHLTQELGMCCGGQMSIWIEVIETAPVLHVFGAGYIAQSLAALAAGCGFRVKVVDERPEWANAERFPAARVSCRSAEDAIRAHPPEPRDYVVVVTHDHALDQRLVQELLARPLAFLGMIGSVPKQRKFALRLRARGFSDEQIARLRTPLGLAIGARSPEEIAVSVMAELIAVRRGARVEPGWTPPSRVRAREESSAEAPAAAEGTNGTDGVTSRIEEGTA